jgi:Tfp pilus assembly protein PilX
MRDKLCHFIDAMAARGRDESGVAMVMVLLVTAILLGIGLALSTNSMLELDIASNHQRETVAWYAAETGLEQAINGFRVDYTTVDLPADGTVVFNQQPVSYPGLNQTGDYTVTLARRDSPASSPISPYPIYYTITSVGRYVPANTNVQPSSVTLTQTLAVSPQTLANWTLFYNQFPYDVWFQPTFTLAGRLAVNDPAGVNCVQGTTINGDFYAAGPINRNPPYGVPTVSGNITENGGQISFPQTIDPFSSGATSTYQFNGTTRLIFQDDGTVIVHNNLLSPIPLTMNIPPNGIIAVNGDVVVEGTVHGRCTVTATGSALLNGNIQYSDHSPSSTDTLAVVAQLDVIEPENYYTGVTGPTLRGFAAVWNDGHWQADGITGGTWGDPIVINNPPGNQLPGDVHIDGTFVSLTGSSPTVIDPGGRPPGNLYVYGNDIANIASVTVSMNPDNSIAAGLNEMYTQNKKLDLFPPPGFPFSTKVLPSFFAFREVRTAIH